MIIHLVLRVVLYLYSRTYTSILLVICQVLSSPCYTTIIRGYFSGVREVSCLRSILLFSMNYIHVTQLLHEYFSFLISLFFVSKQQHTLRVLYSPLPRPTQMP